MRGNVYMSDKNMPILAVTSPVPSENIAMHFEVKDVKMARAMEEAIAGEKFAFMTYQRAYDNKNGQSQLSGVGVICTIKQLVKHKDGSVHVMLEGRYRGRIVSVTQKEPYLAADIARLPKVSLCGSQTEIEAIMQSLKSYFENYTKTVFVQPELFSAVMGADNPYRLFDLVAQTIHIKPEERQMLLETDDLLEKMTILFAVLAHETDVAQLQSRLTEKVRSSISDENHRHFLREQLKTIRKELGENGGSDDDEAEFDEKIEALPIDDVYKAKLQKDAARLMSMPSHSSEYALIEAYLETVIELPFDKRSEENRDIIEAEKILNADHFGLLKVKERILELLSVRAIKPDVKGQII
jgi:ATP-dependent Lon protease